jgi:hypothetical protein
MVEHHLLQKVHQHIHGLKFIEKLFYTFHRQTQYMVHTCIVSAGLVTYMQLEQMVMVALILQKLFSIIVNHAALVVVVKFK